jgi:hypothetical protein
MAKLVLRARLLRMCLIVPIGGAGVSPAAPGVSPAVGKFEGESPSWQARRPPYYLTVQRFNAALET